MIFGHSFNFLDEAVLQQEYNDSFPAVSNVIHSETVQVIKFDNDTILNDFSFLSDWIELSGQEARYSSASPVSRSVKEFSWALEIKEVLTLIWDAKKRKIIYIQGENYTPQRLRFWIYHTFFPIVLELERIYRILHVGSVEIKGKPVIFSAFSFGGKSTMTDYFIQKGHTILSDDSLAIDKRGNNYYAIASYPFHRPYREPEVLGYPVKNFATEPKPLHAMYLLEKSEPDAAVEINEVTGIDKFKAFHYSSFINFDFMKQERFAFFMEMAKHITVYTVKVPWDLERLGEVYTAIVKYNDI